VTKWDVFEKPIPSKAPRTSIHRARPDKSAALRLRDPEGHTRILLCVSAGGTPTMQFLDAAGRSCITGWTRLRSCNSSRTR
jgi:hypothetical protein